LGTDEPSSAKVSEGILLRGFPGRQSCEARQREAGWRRRSPPNPVPSGFSPV